MTDPSVAEPIEPQEQEVAAPLVFMCKACGSIVADSWSWVCSNQDLNSITLETAAETVRVLDRLNTSKRDVDVGSTFTAIACSKSCGATLGRMYKTTARRHDSIRDLITLDCDSINSYQLGTGKPPGSTEAQEALDSLMDLRHTMSADIVKLQNMILVHDERLQSLEESASTTQTQRPTHAKSKKQRTR